MADTTITITIAEAQFPTLQNALATKIGKDSPDADDIKEVEKQFKDLQIGREHKNLNIPPHFMGKTEIIKEDVSDEIVIQRMEDIKVPTKTTLEDF